ncbi:hypothetical protein [Photorhabdus bodei]|uniref:Uncharacterized protein n=1 Tax=Photorhabdus bodei TaxID=2029681 RepID=A0ABX0AQC5_9GAMM|nr:hypothetical protein [Photorhabdus bodei]NDL00796.1 hypothetical protein [Photorhabdus bodei]NDL04962.1 hypothetical protein [Photorhabdus bodei]NDL09295.1 hypothetical protein [Photorhabdus bodei]
MKFIYTLWISRCIATARERIPGSIANYVTGVSECSQQRGNLKDNGYRFNPSNGRDNILTDMQVSKIKTGKYIDQYGHDEQYEVLGLLGGMGTFPLHSIFGTFSKNRRKPLPSAGRDIRRKAQRALGLATATSPG